MSKHKGAKSRESTEPGHPTGAIAVAARWPLFEVLLSRDWDTPGNLVTILVARRAPDSGKVAAAYFLVDLACLGVKSVQVKRFKDTASYSSELRAHALRVQPMAAASLDLAAKIIYTGLEYAASLGFKPDFVFRQAEPVLSSADPAACSTPVPTGGPEGKPLFVNGPHDDVDRIIAQLRRAVGDGNFDYLIGGSPEELRLP